VARAKSDIYDGVVGDRVVCSTFRPIWLSRC